MAGDWIKMREALYEDPAVLQMANELKTRPEHVVGYLHRFWGWASRNVVAQVLRSQRNTSCANSATGVVRGATIESIESVLNLPGFLTLMCKVGWLEYENHPKDGPIISIPKFDRHLSSGAKARALAARRMEKSRSNEADEDCCAPVAQVLRSQRNKSATREEKRRVSNTDTCKGTHTGMDNQTGNNPSAQCAVAKKRQRSPAFVPPSFEELSTYLETTGLSDVDPEAFIDHYQAKGWKIGSRSMIDWRAAARKANREGWCKPKPKPKSRFLEPHEFHTYNPIDGGAAARGERFE